MRIVAGIYKSRLIKAPNGIHTRPTSDKVKGSIFNIIGYQINHAKCLDLFAGSGNLGIEAISRGASQCVFVDNDKNAISCIKENIQTLKIQNQTSVYLMDYHQALKKIEETFDVIFLDPPYRYKIILELIELIEEKEMLSKNGMIVYESNIENQINEELNEHYHLKKYKYGDTILNILIRK